MCRKIAIGLLLLTLGAMGSLTGPGLLVKAAPADFLGTWVNVDQDTRGLTTLNIVTGGTGLMVQGFGKCHPTDCDWGFIPLNLFGYSVTDTNPTWGMATWDFGFSETTLVIHREGDQLIAETYTVFKDNSGRANYRALYLMQK